MQTMTLRQDMIDNSLPAGLSPVEKAKVSALMRKMGRDDFLVYACRLALGVKPTFRTVKPQATRAARKMAILERAERNAGVKFKKTADLDIWLEQVVDLPDPHPDIADMSDDDLMAFVNAEVKQYREERRVLQASTTNH